MFSIVIQAGGQSRRMGQDKALLPLLGKPLIQHVLERVQSIADELLITTNRVENFRFLGVSLYPDIVPNRGALGGLYTALSCATQPIVAVIACDMPFINANLLVAERDLILHNEVDVVIPETGSGLEPFHAVYRRLTCLPEIRIAMDDGKWRVDSWFSRAKVHIMHTEQITQYDPQQLSFWNVNTPDDLSKAEEILRQRTRTDAK